MAGQDIFGYLSLKGGPLGDPQPDPFQSLGGFRSATPLHAFQGQVTAASTDRRRLISSEVADPAAPVSGVTTDPRVNSGDYDGASNLVHYWRPGHEFLPSTAFGQDFGNGTPIDVGTNLEANFDLANLEVEQPGQFFNARRSYNFPDTGTTNSFAGPTATVGIANVWTILLWMRPQSIAAGIRTALSIGFSSSHIQLERNADKFRVNIRNDANSNQKIYQTQTGALDLTTGWHACVARWDGTTLSLFVDGVLENNPNQITDQDVTQTDQSRQVRFGESNLFFSREFDGNVHSALIWDTDLSDAAITAVSAFGDGPDPGPTDRVGQWVSIQNGTAAMSAARIESFDETTGEMRFHEELTAAPAVNDVFRIFANQNLFPAASPAMNTQGFTIHRGIFVRNQEPGSANLADVRLWPVPLEPGPTDLRIAPGDFASSNVTMDELADELEVPDLSAANAFTNVDQGFRAGHDYASAIDSPIAGFQDLSANGDQFMGVYLELTAPPLSRQKQVCAWGLALESATTGNDPDPFRILVAIFVFELQGLDANVTVRPDSAVFVEGEASIRVKAVDVDTAIPLEGLPAQISIDAGPGTLNLPSEALVLDERGEARVTYVAPTDPMNVGDVVTVRGEVD